MEKNNTVEINSLQSCVYQTNCQINDLQGDISALRRKLVDTQEMQEQHRLARALFENDHFDDVQSAKRIAAVSSMRLAKHSADRLFQHTSSRKITDAYDEMDRNAANITNEIIRIEQEIEIKEREIYNLQNQISSLQHQIYALG